MAGENYFWFWLRDLLKDQLPGAIYHHQRIEDSLSVGIPDVNICVQGREYWLELKSLSRWPVRDHTPVTFERYTLDQRKWLRSRWRAGGRSFLVLRVATPGVVLVWNGETAYSEVEGFTRDHLMGISCGIWSMENFSARKFFLALEKERH